MTRSWREVRSEAAPLLNEQHIAEHRARFDAEVRAYRLRQLREAQHVPQSDIAAAMRVSQSRVSRIEGGEIDRTEVGTLQAYIRALGGRLRLIADFGDETLVIG